MILLFAMMHDRASTCVESRGGEHWSWCFESIGVGKALAGRGFISQIPLVTVLCRRSGSSAVHPCILQVQEVLPLFWRNLFLSLPQAAQNYSTATKNIGTYYLLYRT